MCTGVGHHDLVEVVGLARAHDWKWVKILLHVRSTLAVAAVVVVDEEKNKEGGTTFELTLPLASSIE